MRVLLLGANGRTGLLTLAEALSRNHNVTALVRRPDAITQQPGVSIITGTPLSQADIAKAFSSAPPSDPVKAVICTLNNGRTSDFPWARTTAPKDFMADCMRNTVVVMRDHGVKTVVVLGTIGVGDSRAASGWFFNKVVEYSNLKITFDDHYAVQKLLEEEAQSVEGFNWTDVRAVGLSNGKRQPVKEFGNVGKGAGWFISRDSVAKFLLDAVEGDKYNCQTPVISN